MHNLYAMLYILRNFVKNNCDWDKIANQLADIFIEVKNNGK